jgi:transcriptional regulator with XRE-family HTH domain
MSIEVSLRGAVGARLREERERLGVSQALFSGNAGVSRMSQVNYESGKRTPDAKYLRTVAEYGVDVLYVVTGKRSGQPDFFRLATIYVLESVQMRTGFAEDILTFVIEALAQAASAEWLDDPDAQHPAPGQHFAMDQWVDIDSVHALMTALFENARLLRDIFGIINMALDDINTAPRASPAMLSGSKRLALVIMLFKAFRAAGEADFDVVRDAVRLSID